MGCTQSIVCKEPTKTRNEDKLCKTGNFKTKSQSQEDGTALMTYKLFYSCYDDVNLFGKEFVGRYKDRCKMLIHGQEYEILGYIKKWECEKYGINEQDEILEVVLKAKGITDMSWMFCGCRSLTQLDLSSFDTQNVTSMKWMFCGCENLIKLDLSSFKTQNVTSMGWMFYKCKSLIKLDLSSFNTQNVTSMYEMFYGCKSLIKINLGRKGFNKTKRESSKLPPIIEV